jgi:ABC-type glycerol-3-phosphate transport system substrate-binding protein
MSRIDRRSFMKIASIGTGALLAGCTGDSGSGSDGRERIVNNSKGETSSGGSKPFKGVTIKFWDHLNSFSREARNTITRITKDFEADTGANVKITFDGPGALTSKWPQAMSGGNIPHIHSYNPAYSGSVPTKFWVPFTQLRKEYPNEITDSKVNSMSIALEHLKFASRGMDTDIPQAPALHVPRSPLLTRFNFFKKAGVANRMPPQNFDDAVKIAKIVQQNTSVKAGYQYPGAKGDYFGFVGPHAVMAGGRDGAMLTENATDHNIDDDSFLTALKRMAKIRDEGLIVNNTASLSGDTLLGTIGSGEYGMVTVEPKFQPTALNRNRQLMKQGELRYFPNWNTKSGQLANNQVMTFNITPKQRDTQKAQKQQDAAVHFLANYLMSKEFHTAAAAGTGFIPAREDVWDQAAKKVVLEDKHHWFKTCTKLLENTNTLGLGYGRPDKGITVLPALSSGGTAIQKMVLGELSAKEAHQEWVEAANKSYS